MAEYVFQCIFDIIVSDREENTECKYNSKIHDNRKYISEEN